MTIQASKSIPLMPVDSEFDVIIIGAGINGAGIARDAAMRGLKVLLLDKGDIGEWHQQRFDAADSRRPAISRAFRVWPRARVASRT